MTPVLVLAHGTFDLLHIGHIRHLREAKAQGSRLVVSVTSDRFVNKGMGRPTFSQEQRMEAIRALACVDEVVLNDAPNAVPMIELLQPAVFAKGVDYTTPDAGLDMEREAVEKIGGKLYITQSEKWSSSRLLNAEKYNDETMAFLERVRPNRNMILEAFDEVDRMQVAFVGETILDVYRYVRAIGKPSKELTLATVETGGQGFQGGVIAASTHAEWKNIKVVTSLPIKKTRYVDADFSRKLFEIYSDRQIVLTDKEQSDFTVALAAQVQDADCLVMFDFGHGLIQQTHRVMVEGAKFFAVNAQSNAGNYGFNPVTKYRRANLVCVDDPEARLATGMQHQSIGAVVAKLANLVEDAGVIVTHGSMGCYCLDKYEIKPTHIPALSNTVVDTMGAGDAFLAVAGPLLATGLPLDLATFCGAVAGAIKVSIVGHRRHVGRQELLGTINGLLK